VKGGDFIENIQLKNHRHIQRRIFLCMGGDLADIRFRQNGKQIASFLFTGPDLAGHDKAYRNGNALVNTVQFRESLNRLRDILFENLRQNGDKI